MVKKGLTLGLILSIMTMQAGAHTNFPEKKDSVRAAYVYNVCSPNDCVSLRKKVEDLSLRYKQKELTLAEATKEYFTDWIAYTVDLKLDSEQPDYIYEVYTDLSNLLSEDPDIYMAFPKLRDLYMNKANEVAIEYNKIVIGIKSGLNTKEQQISEWNKVLKIDAQIMAIEYLRKEIIVTSSYLEKIFNQ